MRLSGASGSFKTEEMQTQHEILRQPLSVLISDFGCKLREGMHIKARPCLRLPPGAVGLLLFQLSSFNRNLLILKVAAG